MKGKIKDFIKQNWFKIIIAAGILSFCFLVGYYLFIYVPKYNQEKLVEQKQLNLCLNTADSDYQISFDKGCMANGGSSINIFSNKFSGECRNLPSWNMKVLEDKDQQDLEKVRQQDKENCFKQYPQN